MDPLPPDLDGITSISALLHSADGDPTSTMSLLYADTCLKNKIKMSQTEAKRLRLAKGWRSGFGSRKGLNFFSLPSHSLRGLNGRSVKLTTDLSLMQTALHLIRLPRL
jgi:hypothetical protein